MDLTTLMAVTALVVSIVSVVMTYRLGKSQNDLQGRLLSIEARREQVRNQQAASAALSAEVYPSGNAHKLAISNGGGATARHIQVLFDGKPLSGHRVWVESQSRIATIAPGSSAEYWISITSGAPSKVMCRIEWEDDSGEPGIWESDVSLY